MVICNIVYIYIYIYTYIGNFRQTKIVAALCFLQDAPRQQICSLLICSHCKSACYRYSSYSTQYIYEVQIIGIEPPEIIGAG